MDYNKLIEQLRSTESRSKRKMLDDAAAAIETLLMERDAAIADIKHRDGCEVCKHVKSNDPFCMVYDCDCEFCTSELCVCRHCRDEDKWEWRGPQREEK